MPVEVHRPSLFLSLPGKASVTIDGATYRAKPMAMSVAYPAGVTAPLVHVPARYAHNADEMFTKGFVSETEVDLRRKIVVSEGFGMPGKVAYFEQRGAIGMMLSWIVHWFVRDLAFVHGATASTRDGALSPGSRVRLCAVFSRFP